MIEELKQGQNPKPQYTASCYLQRQGYQRKEENYIYLSLAYL